MSEAKKVCANGRTWFEVVIGPDPEKSVSVRCPFCGSLYVFKGITQYDVNAPGLMQDKFPNVDADWREMFISGMCPKCWKETFGDEE